jgi:glucose-6-phosphate dehydrogenase assembly protein OpcA
MEGLVMAASPALADRVPVRLSDIERELGRQMKVEHGPGEHPVIQARMSNLVIFCNRADLARNIEAEIPAIVAVHPARVLLLVVESETSPQGSGVRGQASEATKAPGVSATPEHWSLSPSSGLLAYVGVRVQRLGREQICSEQVTLCAREEGLDRLPFAVRALLIGDLPTNLWWATPDPPPPLAGPLLEELAEDAQQLLYDSQGWPDPHRGVEVTAAWLEQFEGRSGHSRWRVASDLSWRRLKTWRRFLAQTLDPALAPGVLDSVTEVLLEHGPHAVTQAWQLVGWLASRLGWRVEKPHLQPGVEISWRVRAPHGRVHVRIHRLAEGPPEVRRVRIGCTLQGKARALNLIVEDERRLAVMFEGDDLASRTVTLQRPTLADLVARQLSDREPDPVFRESLRAAKLFARSVMEK